MANFSANRRENWGKPSVFRYRGVVRVVALLVILCSCRAAAGSGPVDASTPRGDGLSERVTTDASFDGFPMFSPDGRSLVWASNRHATVATETNLFIADWMP